MTLIMEEFPDVFYSYNPFFYVTNTSKSLEWGLRHLDDDILWLNGDVVFDEQIIKKILQNNSRNLVCVDKKRCGEEEVKYISAADGSIKAISKAVETPEGEALGINFIQRASLPDFKQALKDCADMDYFEHAIELIIERGHTLFPLDISEYRCVEVDFDEDWELAQKVFAKG